MKKILIVETEYEGHYLTGYIKYILRSLEYGKSLHLIVKTKEFKPLFSIINLYKSAF